MGPGGRLRPAPRAHRNVTRVEPAGPPGFIAPRGPDAGISNPSSTMLTADDLGDDDQEQAGDEAGPRHEPDDSLAPAPSAVQPMAGMPAAVGPYPSPREPSQGEARQPRFGPSHARRFDRAPASGGQPTAPGQTPVAQGRSEPGALERTIPARTTPQLRRVIKSRASVPMHELRRRFGIEGDDDDVTAVDFDSGRVFVGLPPMEARLLGDLMRGGEVGFELSRDPRTPIVVGVYAMRPVPRS